MKLNKSTDYSVTEFVSGFIERLARIVFYGKFVQKSTLNKGK